MRYLLCLITALTCAACQKTPQKEIPTCAVLVRHVVEALSVGTKEDKASAAVTASQATLVINGMCDRTPWNTDARLCLSEAKTREQLRMCGEAGKQAEGAFNGIADVKGMSGGPQYDDATGRWGHRDKNGNWIDDGP